MKLWLAALFVLVETCSVHAAPDLAAQAESAWQATWQRFYLPKTHLLYDYLTSNDPGKGLAFLPTLAEMRQRTPDTNGYGTGMEDTMISAGVMLLAIANRYEATRDESLREKAEALVQGIRLCTFAHGTTGFVARGVSAEDLKSCYPDSSRDQSTHAMHGLWTIARSPLADARIKAEAAGIAAAVARRMLANVTPANGYNSLNAENKRDARGLLRMGKVGPHEVGRLPMYYAIAAELTGDARFEEAYRRYAPEAIEVSGTFEKFKKQLSGWSLLQFQCSLEVLQEHERAPETKARIAKTMDEVAAFSWECAKRGRFLCKGKDFSVQAPDWRKVGGLVKPYRDTWYAPRYLGECQTAALLDRGTPMPPQQREALAETFRQIDFTKVSTCGIFHLQSAYWLARARAK